MIGVCCPPFPSLLQVLELLALKRALSVLWFRHVHMIKFINGVSISF